MQKNDLKTCKRQKGKIFSIIIAFLLCAELSAHSGMLTGEKNLRVVKTTWFDIIYPERCEESAAILYEKADTVYEEVTAQYGLKPSFRIPVVITPAVEQFNAFWTSVPYNHIAIYDTGSSGSGSLAVFTETLLSTFRHELTHAVTFNMKDPFWRAVDKVFGDCVSPGMISVTTGMAEGATVTSESAAGEGRLNDEYAKHYVKQAKIEDKFPSYHDVSGASDVMPGGAPYYFNGAFHQWLQDNYGMEAYAEFWYRVVNGRNFTISGAFKKSFNIKLKKAWELFKDSYEVPSVAANPVEAGLAKDFFEPSEREYSRMNDAGSVFGSLSVAKQRLVWMDSFGDRVYAAETSEEKGNSETAPEYKKLFSLRGLDTVRLSNDGRFLAASYISENGIGERACVAIYDFTNKAFYYVNEKGLKEAAIVQKDGEWYLLGQKYLNQHYSIAVYKLILNDNGTHIKDTEFFAETKLDNEVNPYAFVPLNDGTFAWLKKDRLNFSICVSSVEGNLLQEYKFPAGTAVHSLSFTENPSESLYFSYAQKGTLPRLGSLNLESKALSLDTKDISGGVFEPVYWCGKIVYIGQFYRQHRILCLDAEKEEKVAADEVVQYGGLSGLAAGAAGVGETAGAEISENPVLIENVTTSLSLPSKKYNPLPYLARGIFIPISTYESDYFGSNAAYTKSFNRFWYGGTYITANPWASGSADLYQVTAGWNPLSNSFGTALTISKGTATSLLGSTTQLKSEFDADGWKQGGAVLNLSSVFRVGKVSSIILQNSASALFGRQDKALKIAEDDDRFYSTLNFWDKDLIGIAAPESDEMFYSLTDVITAQYSNIRKGGPGRFENTGFGLAVSYGQRYDASLEEDTEYEKASALGAAAKVCIPHLMPFESKYGFTYNLPVTIGLSLLPSASNYAYVILGEDSDAEEEAKDNKLGRPVFDASVEAIAFSMDIQKAIPGITAVFLNDFYVAGGYAATGTAGTASEDGFQTKKLGDYFEAIGDGRGYYLDSVYLKAGLEFTPNIGLIATPGAKMGINLIYSYTLHSSKALKMDERYKLTIGFDMNF